MENGIATQYVDFHAVSFGSIHWLLCKFSNVERTECSSCFTVTWCERFLIRMDFQNPFTVKEVTKQSASFATLD